MWSYQKSTIRFKIIFALLLIVIPITVGVIGYMLIEKLRLLDAVYMTVITIATVGYGEVRPLTDEGRIFTIILIISNLIIFAYAISLITSILIQGDFFETYKTRKMKKQIAQLSQHVIVCGFGRNGKEAISVLNRKKIPFVVIELRKDISEITDQNILFLNDDATKDETLLAAGILQARGLISTLPDDADNVYVTLTARELNQSMTIISRASTDSSVKKLKRAGANNVIMPDKIGGAHMASLIVQPDVNEFIDLISGQGEDVMVQEINMAELMKKFDGDTLLTFDLRKKSGVNPIGLKHADGSYEVNPDINKKLLHSDKIIILATPLQLKQFNALLNA